MRIRILVIFLILFRFKKTGKRDEIFLATKFGFDPVINAINGSPEHVKEQCAKSLERLGVDVIDLYYFHRYALPSTSLTFIESNAIADPIPRLL